MKQENYPAYTTFTNSAISNALALQYMLEAYIDDRDMDVLGSALFIAREQVALIDSAQSQDLLDTLELKARSISVYLMLSGLSDMASCGEQTESLPEAILTMIKSCIIVIETMRCNV